MSWSLPIRGDGTWVPDQGETDEQDGRDEALCPVELGEDFSNLLVYDELRERFRQVPQGAHLTMISDSCHSGTVSRAIPGGVRPAHPLRGRTDAAPRIKYLPPPAGFERAIRAPSRAIHPVGPVKQRLGYRQSGMQEVLLAGASATQFSYDALIGGKRHGAFTYYALRSIEAAHYQLTYLDVIRGVLQRLPFNLYPQTPQLEGSRANKRRLVFAPLSERDSRGVTRLNSTNAINSRKGRTSMEITFEDLPIIQARAMGRGPRMAPVLYQALRQKIALLSVGPAHACHPRDHPHPGAQGPQVHGRKRVAGGCTVGPHAAVVQPARSRLTPSSTLTCDGCTAGADAPAGDHEGRPSACWELHRKSI